MARITGIAALAGGLCFLLGGGAGALTTYEDDAKPIYVKWCAPCHLTGSSGDHSIAKNYDDGLKKSYHCDGKNKAECTVVRIKEGSMPANGNAGKIPAEDLAVLEAWIADGLHHSAPAAPEPVADAGPATPDASTPDAAPVADPGAFPNPDAAALPPPDSSGGKETTGAVDTATSTDATAAKETSSGGGSSGDGGGCEGSPAAPRLGSAAALLGCLVLARRRLGCCQRRQ